MGNLITNVLGEKPHISLPLFQLPWNMEKGVVSEPWCLLDRWLSAHNHEGGSQELGDIYIQLRGKRQVFIQSL